MPTMLVYVIKQIFMFKYLPKKIPIFPLSNFIFFPNTSVPLNIFEPRYLQMVNDSIKKDRLMGIAQPKFDKVKNKETERIELYSVGCVGKIAKFNETEDGRITLILQGISRFKILSELINEKLYREFEVSYDQFKNDLKSNNEIIKSKDADVLFANLKSLFKEGGYIVDWKEINSNSFNKIIDTLSMISPFSLEEKQILLEINTTEERKKKLNEILNIYLKDSFQNKTLQ